MKWFCQVLAGISFCLLAVSSTFSDDNDASFDDVLTYHQKMLVMLSVADNDDPLENNVFYARNYYVFKREAIEHIIEFAEDDTSKGLSVASAAFIDYYQQADLADADKLAFIDLVDELLWIEAERDTPKQALTTLRLVSADIQQAFALYRKDYLAITSKMRGAKPQAWSDYIKQLVEVYPVDELLVEIANQQLLSKPKTRGAGLAQDQADALGFKTPQIIWGNGLPEKTVVLTFDDGPHRARTSKILDILKEYDVNGYFFAVGRNLGAVAEGKAVLNKRNKAVINRIINEGHILANHSFSHKELTKLTDADKKLELANTNALIKAATGYRNPLFRPPYGSKNSALEDVAKSQGLSSIMWNVDSMDWSDPVPESIVSRVMARLEKRKKGILLFHDIHKQTVEALPLLLQALAKQKYRVVAIDGSAFSSEKTGVPKLPQAEKPKLYGDSWAVVIGVNNYQHWPKLDYAVADAQSIKNTLVDNFGFKPDHVIELYDENATRSNITEALGYTLADPKKIKPEDRVFVFYAGHGATRGLPNGGNLGYIVPVDADYDRFQTEAISMSMLDDFASLSPAKHMYFVMDSCYSGLALTRAGGPSSQAFNYVKHITSRNARQILTAGGADQEVADGGPDGHSVFTWALLQALSGEADTDNNGYITASEIGTYVTPVVASYAPQTPAFGNLVGSRGGDFVFEISSEGAKRAAQQRAAVKQAQQAAVLQASDLKADVKRRIEITSVTSSTNPGVSTDANSSERAKLAYKLDAEALKLFHAGKLKQAELKWAEAARLNPYNIHIVNNYGYVLDKLDKNDEALKWYYRAVEIDPKRKPLYLNLGDMMMKLGRIHAAVPYYERYLHLNPSYKKAGELKEKIKAIQEGTYEAETD